MRDGRQQVVILYSHPLLGEGLGRLLAADPGLFVEMVPVDDLDGAERALVNGPDVVILERTPPVQALDLMRLAPSALVIDVGLDAGPTWTWRRDELPPQPEELLRVIHGRDRHDRSEALAPESPLAAELPLGAEPPVPVIGSGVPAGPVTGPVGAVTAKRVATALRSVGA